jgi:hypothetical protein
MAKAMTLALGAGLTVPIEMAGQAVALVGIRGSGKTNTAGVIAEELLDHGQQIVVIDPTDAWWGLRSKYPVFIFGGPHGDLPLAETDGKTLAEFVVQEQVPIILSLRHLRKGAQRRLVTEFCEELYHLKGRPEYRTPLTVFMDEAPQFVPQVVRGDMARLVGAVQDMILLGRSSGFGVVMISQRFATLNADVRTQADTIIVHRLPSPLDRKALTEWIEENASIDEQKAVLSTLAKLDTGEAWVWAPYFDLFQKSQIRPRRTFDSSAAPKRGEVARVPKDLTKVDIEKLKGKLSAAVAEARANDPKELRTKVEALTRELEKTRTASTASARTDVKTRSVELLTDADRAAIAKITDLLKQSTDGLAPDATAIRLGMKADIDRAVEEAGQRIEVMMLHGRKEFEQRLEKAGFKRIIEKLERAAQIYRSTAPVTITAVAPASAIARPATPVRHHVSAPSGDEIKLKKGAREILAALAIRHPKAMTWSQLALKCGIKSTGSTMSSYMSNLRTAGLIGESGENVNLTNAGLDAAGGPGAPPTPEQLLAMWLPRFKKGARAILENLMAAYPKYRSKEELGELLGGIAAGGSTLSSYLSNLRTAGVIEERGSEVRASEELFS